MRIMTFLLIIIVFVVLNFSAISQEEKIKKEILSQPSSTGQKTPQKTPSPTPQAQTKAQPKTTQKATTTGAKKTPTKTKAKTTKKKATTKKVASKKSISRKKPTGRKSQATFSQFTMTADQNAAILFFFPPDITTSKGEKFFTDIMLTNPSSTPFERIILNIKYDPDFVSCFGIEKDSEIFKFPLEDEPQAKIYPNSGRIIFSAKLKQPRIATEQKILTLHWKTIESCENTTIEFEKEDTSQTAILHSGYDILGDISKNDDGIINASVQIVEQKPVEEESDEFEEGTEVSDIIIFDKMPLSGRKKFSDVKLFLIAPEKPVKVGDIFPVDIYLSNPNRAPIDAINLVMTFDPETIQVIDKDEENWITVGTNIFDGNYHEQFPFDYHIQNEVINKEGIIYYKVGCSNPESLPKKGKFATIYFKSLKPDATAKILFKRSTSPSIPGTAVLSMGRNILDVSENSASVKKSSKTSNLLNATIQIIQ